MKPWSFHDRVGGMQYVVASTCWVCEMFLAAAWVWDTIVEEYIMLKEDFSSFSERAYKHPSVRALPSFSLKPTKECKQDNL